MKFNLHMLKDAFLGMNHVINEVQKEVILTLTGVFLFRDNSELPGDNDVVICTIYEYLSNFSDVNTHSFVLLGTKEEMIGEEIHQNAILLFEPIFKEDVYVHVLEWLQSFHIENEKLREKLTASNSLEVLTKIVKDKVHNPIALFDASYQLIDIVDIGVEIGQSTVWKNVIEKGAIDLRIYSHHEMKDVNRAILDRMAFMMFKKDDMDHIILPMYEKVQFLGNLSSVSFSGGFTLDEVSWLLHISRLIHESLFLQTKAQGIVLIAPKILLQIINSSTYSNQHLSFFISQYSWIEREYFRLYLCELESDKSLNHEIIGKYIFTLKNEFESAIIFYYSNQILMITPDGLQEEKQQRIFEKLRLKVGISNPMKDIRMLKIAYQQAKEVLKYSDQTIDHFEEQAFMISLDVILSDNRGEGFVYLPILYRWQMGDDKERDFLKSAYVYLTSERNLHRASKSLNLHRNSLKYRLQRISEAIEVDLLYEDLSPSIIYLMVITLYQCIVHGVEEHSIN